MASCSDIGCAQGQKEFEHGSARHNPMIPPVRRVYNLDNASRFIYGQTTTYKDGVKVE
jgi:hypothetical protein